MLARNAALGRNIKLAAASLRRRYHPPLAHSLIRPPPLLLHLRPPLPSPPWTKRPRKRSPSSTRPANAKARAAPTTQARSSAQRARSWVESRTSAVKTASSGTGWVSGWPPPPQQNYMWHSRDWADVRPTRFLQATHKTLHKAANSMLATLRLTTPRVVSKPDADGHFNPFPAYPFTGPLRPVYPLSPRRTVPDHIKKPDYWSNGIPKSEQVSSHEGSGGGGGHVVG